MRPVQAIVEFDIGFTAELRVYAEGAPFLESHEIVWKRSDGTRVFTDDRVSLHDSNHLLLIRDMILQDIGVYKIEINREIKRVAWKVLASTTIELRYFGKFRQRTA